jgi:hypothetical protein
VDQVLAFVEKSPEFNSKPWFINDIHCRTPLRGLARPQAVSVSKYEMMNRRMDDESSHQRDRPFPATTQSTPHKKSRIVNEHPKGRKDDQSEHDKSHRKVRTNCHSTPLDIVSVNTVANLSRRDAVDAHIRSQNFGNQDGAVSLLIILHDRDPSTAYG